MVNDRRFNPKRANRSGTRKPRPLRVRPRSSIRYKGSEGGELLRRRSKIRHCQSLSAIYILSGQSIAFDACCRSQPYCDINRLIRKDQRKTVTTGEWLDAREVNTIRSCSRSLAVLLCKMIIDYCTEETQKLTLVIIYHGSTRHRRRLLAPL